ncbi:hypothetical protein B0H66DRAFT_637922 [Apodospora peruviana]|uniref:Protein kinase domain-containing protein n=1 Tax=Apodospora peruviana TaxID=516989 RepID=A0AAE0MCH9_9PEZI|nr:hypothetical protein B0H66DRAFT_637922 [Apodospora peruviana]
MSTVTEDEAVDYMGISEIEVGKDEGTGTVTFDFNDKHFAVSVCLDNSSQKTEHHFFKNFLGKACNENADDGYEDTVGEILDVILDAGKAVLCELAPLLPPQMARTSAIPALPASAPDEAMTTDEPPFDDVYNIDNDLEADESLPRYSSHDIQVFQMFLFSGIVSRVQVNGSPQMLLCKVRKDGLLDNSLERELACLQTIKASGLPTLRIPRLIGYVEHDAASDSMTSKEQKKKWAAEIRDAVDQLHKIGLVWGDGKPSNVIVDDHDDAWLIDLAGGWTQEWVDKQVAGTVEGDEQVLRNIYKFLRVDHMWIQVTEGRGSMAINTGVRLTGN